MRTYGRVTDATGARFWVQVDPDAQGNNDSIFLTALVQTLKLNWGESPFFGDWGIPAHETVVTQVFPDYYVMLTQQRYAPYFGSLIITKEDGTVTDAHGFPVPTPTYTVRVQFRNGARISTTVIPAPVLDQFGIPEQDQNGYFLQSGTQTGRFVAV